MYREMGIKTPITEKTSTKKTIVSREQQLLEKYLPTYVSLQELRERLDVLKERNNVKEFRTTKESI